MRSSDPKGDPLLDLTDGKAFDLGHGDAVTPSPDLGLPPVITALDVNETQLWDGEALSITVTVAAQTPLQSVLLTDGSGASYGALSQIGVNQFSMLLSWSTLDAKSDLTFAGSATRVFLVTVKDVANRVGTAEQAVTFQCSSGACTDGICAALPTGTLSACTTQLDQLTTCTEICERTGQSCLSLGCDGYTGTLVAPDCSGSDESGLTSTLDGSKMTCDSFFLAISTLSLGGVRCCCGS